MPEHPDTLIWVAGVEPALAFILYPYSPAASLTVWQS